MQLRTAETRLTTGTSDRLLESAILAARTRSLAWYASMQADGQPIGVLRISAAHDPQRWPGMLLPGTYNGLIGQTLIGGVDHLGVAQRQALTQWLLAQRRADGVFRIAGMQDGEIFKKPDLAETRRYIDFHVTNYALGAIACIAPDQIPQLDFVYPYLDRQLLLAWLAERDLRDPWLEGNNIVNLGSFLLLLQEIDAPRWQEPVQAALQTVFAWHDRLQEPSTGFWGVGQLSDATRLLHAMAGSMHSYHLWYACGRRLAYQDKAVNYCLTLPPTVHSACIDVDLVDLLAHASWQTDHRRGEIHNWLRALLPELLGFQNADGGFPDVHDGPGIAPRRQDGWIKGYAEAQGQSNTFATWFRWIAIAMIARCLWPQWTPFAGGWRFRRTPGIGYCCTPDDTPLPP